MRDVVVVGNTVADVLVEAERLPRGAGAEFGPWNLEVTRDPARVEIGGNAGRSAAVLAELGAKVRLYTRLGTDFWGDWLRGELGRRGIDVVWEEAGVTATNVVGTDGVGRRMSLFFPGGADYGIPDVSGSTRMVIVAGCPFPELRQLARWLPTVSGEVPVLVDPGPNIGDRPSLAGLARVRGPETYLTVNAGELSELTGSREWACGLRRAESVGFGRVVVKLGARGAVVWSAPSARAVLLPTEAVPEGTHSTVGAGDAFNAGLAFGLAEGFGLWTAAALGNRVARCRLSGGEIEAGRVAELLSHLEEDVEMAQEV